MDFKNCLGMIASVSTLALSKGATKPFNWVKACMFFVFNLLKFNQY